MPLEKSDAASYGSRAQDRLGNSAGDDDEAAMMPFEEPRRTTRTSFYSNYHELEASRFNHTTEIARQDFIESSGSLSSSSKDNTEEWQCAQASDELDNANASTLDPQSVADIDTDIMNPDVWIHTMKNAERDVFEKSFVLYSAAQSRANRRDSHVELLRPIPGSINFDTILLPEDCPMAHLSNVWSHLVQQSEKFNSRIPNDAGHESARISAYPEQHIEKLILSRNIYINLCRQVETLTQTIHLPIQGFHFFVSTRMRVLENVAIDLSQLSLLIQHIQDLICHCLDEPARLHGGLPLYSPSSDRIPFGIDGAGNFVTCTSGSDKLLLKASDISEVTRRWFCVAQILDIGLVSYTSAHLEKGDGHAGYLSQQEDYALDLVIDMGRFSPVSLECMEPLLKGSKVWVYSSHNIEHIQPAWMSIQEDVLGNIWGPMWKLTPKAATKAGYYYTLGSGAIGVTASRVHLRGGVDVEQDEIVCHFEPSIDCIGNTILPIEDLDRGRLLIGAAGLHIDTGCNGSEGLLGLRARPHGTSKDGSYLDSITCNITAGWSGSSIATIRD